MKYSIKLSLSIFIVSIFTVIAISIIDGYYLYFDTKQFAFEHLRNSSEAKSRDIGLLLKEKVKTAYTIASNSDLLEALENSNNKFAELNEQRRTGLIEELNERWIAAKDEDDPFVKARMSNDTADHLKQQLKLIPEEYGEIFLTNRYGVMIATTGKLTTLAHSQKSWWQNCYNDGEGQVFFDDRGYDDSVGDYVVGTTIPIFKDRKIIGVLKCNIMLLGSLDKLIFGEAHFETDHSYLFRSGGKIILEKNEVPLSTSFTEEIVDEINNNQIGQFQSIRGKEELLFGFSQIELDEDHWKYVIGGSDSSLGHRYGNTGESWYVADTVTFAEINSIVFEALLFRILLELIFVLLLTVVAFVIGRRLSKPISELAAVTSLASLEDEIVVGAKASGEIATLITSFQKTWERLRKTSTSIDKLEKEINERKQAEKALREAEITRDLALVAAGIGVFDWDVINDQLVWDDELYRLYGVSKAGFSGAYEAWTRGVHPDDLESAENDIQLSLKGEKKFDSEFRVIWPDSTVHHIRGKASVFRNDLGEAVRMLGINWDITETKTLEEELRQHSLMVTSMQDSIIVADLEGRITLWNEASEIMFGFSAEEAKGKFTSIILKPEESENIMAAAVNAMKSEGIWRGEVNFVCKDSATGYCSSTIVPMHDAKGNQIGTLGLNRDITDQRIAEDELKLHSEIMKNMAEGVYLIGADDGKIVYTNPKFEEMFGYEPDEMVGQFAGIVNAPSKSDPVETAKEIMGILNETGSWAGEIENMKKDGTQFWCNANVSVFNHHQYGRVLVAVHTDITDRKQHEEKLIALTGDLASQKGQLEQSNFELKRSNTELESFSYSVSHDLKSPLNHILGYYQLFKDDFFDSVAPGGQKFLARIENSAKRMDQLISDLLWLSKASNAQIIRESINLGFIVKEVISPLLDQYKNKIELNISDVVTANCDPNLIQVVLENLVGNAVKFSSGREKITIEFGKTRNSDGERLFYLKDNGAGFSMEQAEGLFEPFVRLHNEAEFEGTGIGLATVQRIINRHGGRIWAESEPGKGATFFFTLGE
jgi:PAS domain S-box-containing protein